MIKRILALICLVGMWSLQADEPFDYSGRTAAVAVAPSEATGSNAGAIAALHYSSTSVTGLKQLGMVILFR